MKKGFTLAETLIVLVVIGILAAILLPVARNIAPDRNLMKFKKAHNTLGTAIRELVQSEEYYLNGDLGVKIDGTLVDAKQDIIHAKYLCQTLAQVINAKSVNCSDKKSDDIYMSIYPEYWPGKAMVHEDYLDEVCRKNFEIGNEILTNDGVSFYQTCPYCSFGISKIWIENYHAGEVYCDANASSNPAVCPTGRTFVDFKDDSGFTPIYKIFCIDIDGIHPSASLDNCVNECPFGYGIRYDGKIYTGKRATEWLEKE